MALSDVLRLALCLMLGTSLAPAATASGSDDRIDYEACKRYRMTETFDSHKAIRKPKCRTVQLAEGRFLIFRLNPKAGSHTAEALLTELLNRLKLQEAKRQSLSVLHACDHPDIARVRSSGGSFEFTTSREPFDRFISGFYYTKLHLLPAGSIDRGKARDMIGLKPAQHMDDQITEYLRQASRKDRDWHMYPEAHFFCAECEASNSDWCVPCGVRDKPCAAPMPIQYALHVENISTSWPDFVERSFRALVPESNLYARAVAVAKDMANIGRGREALNRGKQRKSSSENITEMLMRDATTVAALCNRLAVDYAVLSGYQSPLCSMR